MLRKERIIQESNPRNHIRKVQTGIEGSSSLETVRRTCSIGEMSSSVIGLRVVSGSDSISKEAMEAGVGKRSEGGILLFGSES